MQMRVSVLQFYTCRFVDFPEEVGEQSVDPVPRRGVEDAVEFDDGSRLRVDRVQLRRQPQARLKTASHGKLIRTVMENYDIIKIKNKNDNNNNNNNNKNNNNNNNGNNRAKNNKIHVLFKPALERGCE